ncbi:MAG: hypothetical protein WBX25_27480, partial [Rhodomicrobium sp.]
LAKAEQTFRVDPAVVKVRDTIAYGRLTSQATAFPLTLHKFGKPEGGMVLIDRAELISEAWLDGNRELILKQINKVHGCARARYYKFIGNENAKA